MSALAGMGERPTSYGQKTKLEASALMVDSGLQARCRWLEIQVGAYRQLDLLDVGCVQRFGSRTMMKLRDAMADYGGFQRERERERERDEKKFESDGGKSRGLMGQQQLSNAQFIIGGCPLYIYIQLQMKFFLYPSLKHERLQFCPPKTNSFYIIVIMKSY